MPSLDRRAERKNGWGLTLRERMDNSATNDKILNPPVLVIWLMFAIFIGIFNMIYQPFFPLPGERMGHDYSFVLPSWLDGYAWFRNNGLAPPWFSPSFCAGQPSFPDPQSSFYSIPQFLQFLLGPIEAAHALLLLCASLLFWGTYLLMRKVFLVSRLVALFVGAIMLFNGFLPHRLVIGHVTFHGFALIPWIALLLLADYRSRINEFAASVFAGLVIAYWVYSGSAVLLLPGAWAIALLLVLHCLQGGSPAAALKRSLVAAVVGAGLSAAKLLATFSYMSNFPRTDYLLPGAASVLDAVTSILGALFIPSMWSVQIGNSRFVNMQWALGQHEWAFNFGTIVAILFLVLVLEFFYRRKPHLPETWRNRALIFVLIIGLAWPIAFNTWGAAWNSFLKTIPVLNSSSTPTRWILVFIPFIAVCAGLLLHRSSWTRVTLASTVCVCLVLAVLQTAVEPRGFFYGQTYDARPMEIADRLMRKGALNLVIRQLATDAELSVNGLKIPLTSNNIFVIGASQPFCYNPVFGYKLENLRTDNIGPGPVLREKNGYLNLKNPACYVFGKENACRPGDLFKSSQLAEATKFTEYKPYVFEISDKQKTANGVTQLSFALLIVFFIFFLAEKAWRRWRASSLRTP
jgi:hypothetical protein